jgi:hypothetical protein
VLDSIVFEQHGVPSALSSPTYLSAPATRWHALGTQGFPLPQTCRNPIANLSGEQLDQRAREIVPEVVRLLLEGQPVH